MGLTIHYGLTSTTRNAQAVVEQMRQLALDLPFERVDDEVQHLGPDVCQRPLDDLRPNETLFSTVLDGCKSVRIPWHRKQQASVNVQPLGNHFVLDGARPRQRMGQLRPCPLPGRDRGDVPSEKRRPFHQDDQEGWHNPLGVRLADVGAVAAKQRPRPVGAPDDEKFQEKRKIKTRLGGWRYSTFCKTQYASDTNCGGIPNFIRCHLCVIHLLDRIAQLPTMKVEIDDEGKYGRSYYTDDPWAEKRVYTWHDGKYDVKALVEEVGEWNEMIAATFGAINDMLKPAARPSVWNPRSAASLTSSGWSSRDSRITSILPRFSRP